MKPLTAFTQVWSSTGTGSQSSASIWAPDLNTFRFSRNKIRICLGHYATAGFQNPASERGTRKLTVEITDLRYVMTPNCADYW